MWRCWSIAFFWLVVSSDTSAAGSCFDKYGVDSGNPTQDCLCSDAVRRLPIPTPDGFTLVAVCGMLDVEGLVPISLKSAFKLPPERFDMGTYLYQGHMTMTGTVIKADNPALGHTVTFTPTRRTPSPSQARKLSRLQEFALLNEFSLIADEKTIGSENLVATERVSWCSDATITLKEVEVYVADTEGEGPLARKYEVVRRSKFRRC
jgi:hypothetical protein